VERLKYVIAFTSDIEEMKTFYRDRVGLAVGSESAFWVDFEAGPEAPSLGLLAVAPQQKREIEMCFSAADLDSEVAALRGRGVEFLDEIRNEAFGRLIHLRDPEGNLVTLLESGDAHPPGAKPGEGGGGTAVAVETLPRVTLPIVNCRDLAAMRTFYRDRLGFHAAVDSPWWVEFAIGSTRLGLHPAVERPVREGHHGRAVTLGFAVDELMAWADEARERGVHFATAPVDEGWGMFADAADPEGYDLTFREPPRAKPIEEELAEAFEDDGAPQHTAIRKPLLKGAGGARLAVRPEYRPKKKAAARKKAARAGSLAVRQVKKLKKAVSPRGSGPAGTRQKPKRVRDPKRARNRPALGRQKKAERRTFKSQKRAVAKASKAKPVKRRAVPRARKK
jgi:lactoylglutathione lyase